MKARHSTLALVVLLASAVLQGVLRSGFTLHTYPWYFPDSYDWVSNGLRYAGTGTDFWITHRTMLLPLIAATLFRVGLENFLPFYGLAWFLVGGVVLFRQGRRIFGEGAALWAAVLYALHYTVLGQSAFLGCDIAASTLLGGASLFFLNFLLYGTRSDLAWSAICMAFGIHSQYIQVVLLPLYFVAWFVRTDSGAIHLTFSRLRHLKEGWFWGCVAGGLLIVGALLAPRWFLFGIIYEERVSHVSLLSWLYQGGRWFYFYALPAVFSIPVLAVALLGLVSSTFAREHRFSALFLLGWAALIGGFFSCLYSWMDARFLIYVALPTILFAGRGLATVISLKAVPTVLRWVVVLVVLVAAHCSPSSDPFDLVASITPIHAVERAPDGSVGVSSRRSQPYFWQHLLERRQRRREVRARIDGLLFSIPLEQIFLQLRNREGISPVWYYQPMQPFEHYIIRNRNIIYYRGHVESVGTAGEIEAAVERLGSITLVARPAELSHWCSGGESLFAEEYESAAGYRAGRVTRESLRCKSKLPEGIASIEAQEYPARLMNGVRDNPEDWAAAPLSQAMVVRFQAPTAYNGLSLWLYGADERRYRFHIVAQTEGATIELYRSPEQGDYQRVDLLLPNKPLKSLSIIGDFNSDTVRNPANQNLHVQELELFER